MAKKKTVKKTAKKKPAEKKQDIKADGVPVFCGFSEIVDADALRPNPRNPNTHPAEQVEILAKIIKYQGWRQNITVSNRSGFIVRGHGRLQAAQHLELKQVPVEYQDYRTEADEWADMIADNKIAEMAEIDWSILGDGIGSFDTGDFDFEMTGYTEKEIADMMAGLDTASGNITEDEIPEPPKVAISKPGDLWLLGSHRLLCGDSTKAEDVERLMGGEKADVCLTDPPYNVGIDYGEYAKDDRPQGDYIEFSTKWFEIAKQISDIVVFTPGTGIGIGHPNLQMWFKIQWPDWILAWIKKNSMVRSSLGGFNNWEQLLLYGKPKKRIPQDIYDIPVTVQKDVSDEKGDKLHPVPKQVKFFTAVIEDFSNSSDLVYDPFSGSGTTIIAAEQLGRKCYAMEIEPRYIDVAVKRWENLTGKKAKLDR